MKCKLLVAEDELIERKVLCRTLQKYLGDLISLYEAKNGREALEIFAREAPQVAVLDIEMPGLTGLEVARKIRETDKNCAILFLTGFDKFDYARQAISVRAMDYLLKPYNEQELVFAVEDAIRQVSVPLPAHPAQPPAPAEPLRREEDEDMRTAIIRAEISRFIDAHYREDISMQDAAAEMGTKEGFHGYGPEQGYPFLKQAIQGYYAGRGTQLAEDEIFISDGAKSDLANVLGLFDVDNTVLVPDPVYPTYVDDNVTDGRKIIYSRTSQENGFLGMPDENVKADIIYICSPNNPTGAAYTRDQLKVWVDYARKNNAIILYDAAYECFISDENLARSIFEIEGARECAIEICSFSKIAGFTGTRCGYTVVPKELEREGMNINKLWLRRQTTKFNGVPYVVQRAAAAVFTESGMAEIQQNLDYYRKNAKVIADALDECGVWYCGGKNSPYIWLRCPGNMKSWEFFDWLLENCGVVGTPGVGFGECGEGYFRLTAFGDAEKTKMAAERIKTAIKAL